jgi:hypothetical protein
MKKKRIEIIAFERERIVIRPVMIERAVCHLDSEWLTEQQAAALIQVDSSSLYRWLVEGKVHSLLTPGGQHRFCKNSLFTLPPTSTSAADPGGR